MLLRASRAAWVCLVAAAPPLHAAPSGDDSWVLAELGAQGSSPCVDKGVLEREVEARLGRKVFDRDLADVVVTLTWSREGERRGVDVQLRTRGGTELGARALEAPGCAALEGALPVVMALMLDVPRSELPQRGALASVPSLATTPLRLPAPERTARPWVLALGPALGWGMQPGLATGGQLLVASSSSGLGWHAALGLYPATRVAAPGASVWTGHLMAGPCIGAAGLRARARACAAPALGWARATGEGWDVNRRTTGLRAHFALGASGEYLVAGPWSLGAAGWAGFRLVADRLVVQADGEEREVYRPALLAGVAVLSAAVVLP